MLVFLVFSTQLCELLQYTVYRQCVAERGLGVMSPVGDSILQEFDTLYLIRFRTYIIALKT
jgi:hypothetical protein